MRQIIPIMDDEDDQKYVCHLCVKEEYLSNLIYKESGEETCHYCGQFEAAIPIGDLASHVDSAFERHFYRTSDQPTGFEYALHADKELDYEWDRHGEPVLWAIAEAADIEEEIAQDLLDILEEQYSDFDSAAMGEETEFDSDSRYEWKRPDDIEFQMDWKVIEDSLRNRSRYFNRTAEEFFDRLFGNLDRLVTKEDVPAIVVAGPDCETKSYFRSRVFHNTADLEKALARPDLELGPPPSRFARAGRMNAQGISVFYGAGDAETAMAEVRPPVGSRVLVGRFDLMKQVRLVDIQALRDLYIEGSYFDPEYLKQLELAKFLGGLSAKMTMPVMPDDEPTEYLITQMIADYLSRTPKPGLDGMLFPSVQRKGDRANVVLFNHASKVAQWKLPDGTRIDASTIDMDEDGGEFSYHVSEIVPLAEGEDEKPRKRFDDLDELILNPVAFDDRLADMRADTLSLDPKSLHVHHIESVSFGTTDYEVTRYRRESGKLPF